LSIKIWEQILHNQNIRQNLSKLRQELKDDRNKTVFLNQIADKEDQLIVLLKHVDAKIRKNTALLMGELGEQKFLKPIYKAYESEDQMFVKSSYLVAIRNFDYGEYLVDFKKRLEVLTKTEMTMETQKHLMEEIRELSLLVINRESISKHEFLGREKDYDIILLTNRNFQEVTMEELKELEPNAVTKVFNAGIMAKVKNLDWLNDIRTFQEILFVIKGMGTCPLDTEKAAEIIVKSDLLRFLEHNHQGVQPYYFRVEIKSKMDLDKKSVFTKRLSSRIEQLSNRNLVNTTAHYEFEIRLIENKKGNCNVLVKLHTLKDERFTYRKEVIPTSIKPVNAAIIVKLTKEYMKEEALVLDPFCGVGTMLVERHKAVRANTSYGIDIQSEAIEKARKNAEAANQIVHFINRDFFDFKHKYLFDEIITNMPFQIGRKTQEEIDKLYSEFFLAAKGHLKDDGIMILYSHDRENIKQMVHRYGFCILREIEISLKEETYVFVLKKGTQ